MEAVTVGDSTSLELMSWLFKDFKRTTSWQLRSWAGAIRQFKQFEFNNAVCLWHKENTVESYLGILKGLNRSLEVVFTGGCLQICYVTSVFWGYYISFLKKMLISA